MPNDGCDLLACFRFGSDAVFADELSFFFSNYDTWHTMNQSELGFYDVYSRWTVMQISINLIII